MATIDLWTQYQRLDNALQLRILLLAGREAAASFRVACGKEESHPKEVENAEQAVLYEPFTYWDWQEEDASFRAAQRHEGGCINASVVGDTKRKRRLLWERERAFSAKGEWHEYPAPQGRWEAFKRTVEKKDYNRKHVKRIAVAAWMKAMDLEWIAQNLSQLEALDLSNLPEDADTASDTGNSRNSNELSWLAHLAPLKTESLEPRYLTFKDFELFTYLGNTKNGKSQSLVDESDRLRLFLENRTVHGYRQQGPENIFESFEEFVWRLFREQEKYEARTGKLRSLEASISESHLLTRLRWLGVRDWRLKPSSKHVCRLAQLCTSLMTLSIRGNYDRDYSSDELTSIHDCVCKFVGGVINTVPDTVKTIELRLSLPFIGYFMEQLYEHKPSVERVGIDLGAWIQVYPLRRDERKLKDADICTRATAVARQKCFDAYEEEHSKVFPKDSMWYLPEDTFSTRNDDHRNDRIYRRKQRNIYRDVSGTVVRIDPASCVDKVGEDHHSSSSTSDDDYPSMKEYDFFCNQSHGEGEPRCPLDHCAHKRTAELLDATRVDTLPRMLKKLHLARHIGDDSYEDKEHERVVDVRAPGMGGFGAARRGAKLCALEPEPEERSTDPIHPLAFVQLSSNTEFKCGDILGDWSITGPAPVYAWLGNTFKWRPVFDWDWFMVPEQMAKTADLDLVSVSSENGWGPSVFSSNLEGNELCRTLNAIATHFRHLRSVGIPVHLLIGRRDPDISSCYWGWPHNESDWQKWKDKEFSANLEIIAPHIDILSVLYDLRNPLDLDRLSEFEDVENHRGTRAMCPLRHCPWKEGSDGTCLFGQFSPSQHPRPQINKTLPPFTKASLQKMANKRKLKTHDGTPKGYGGLANGCAGGPLPGENANDHPSDDSDCEEHLKAGPSGDRLARRAAFTREALGWQRFWNKYALQFTSLIILRVRMPRCFDKIGSWRLAKLLSKHVGWVMLMYTDERQHMQNREDLRPILSEGSASTYEHKQESRVWPAGRFVRRTWVWDSLIMGSEDGFKELEPSERQVLRHDGMPEAPRIVLESDFKDRPDWANRHFEDEDWESTKDGEEKELAKAIARAQDASAHEQAYERPDRLQIRPRPSNEQSELQFCGTYGHHIRNIAGDQWRSELRLLASRLQDDTGPARGLLRNVAERPLYASYNYPPYEAIFRKVDQKDIHPESGIQWKDEIALKSGTIEQIIEEEQKRKARPSGEFLPEYAEDPRMTSGLYKPAVLPVLSAAAPYDKRQSPVCESASSLQHNAQADNFPWPLSNPEGHDELPPASPKLKSSVGPSKRPRKGPFISSSSEDDEDHDLYQRPGKDICIEGFRGYRPEHAARVERVDPAIEHPNTTYLEAPAEPALQPQFELGPKPRTGHDEAVEVEAPPTKSTRKASSRAASTASKSKGRGKKAEAVQEVESVPESVAISLVEDEAVEAAQRLVETTKRGTRSKALKPSKTKSVFAPAPAEEGIADTASALEEPKRKATRKRRAPTPTPSEPFEVDDAAGPAKKAKTAKRASKKGPAYVEVRSDLEETDEEEDDDQEEGSRSTKKGVERTGSGAAFQPPENGEDDGSEDDVAPTPAKGQGRSRARRTTVAAPHHGSKTATTSTRGGHRKSRTRAAIGDNAVDDAEGGGNVAVAGPKPTDYNELTVVKLKELLKKRGIKLTGLTKKAQFVGKLKDLDKEREGENENGS